MPLEPTVTNPVPTVALISGGKDSFFSLIHSNSNGFKVIALANLHPPPLPKQDGDNASDDMNSFMYQTVGHTVLPHYSTILDLPLYRTTISGGAINQDLSYHPSTGETKDETEDLYELLKKVKEAHPDLAAVSSGAILSSYQRTRVESVCQRLGLMSIAWLWQRRQELVLSEMGQVGLDARIIKVASLGLDSRWLGRNVADYQTRSALENVKRKWGGNVAGEGGEFETLVMGCRGWSKRVDVKRSAIVDEGDSVAWTRFLETKVIDVPDPGETAIPPKPPILDLEFNNILEQLKASKTPPQNEIPVEITPPHRFSESSRKTSHNIFIANLSSTAKDLRGQVDQIFTRLDGILQEHSSNKRQVTSTLLLLRSMSDFQYINKPYSSHLSGFPNPPSRVCVSIGNAMPEGTDILLSVMADVPGENDVRKALHVQSRSYWAPANVGPYSQAIAVEGVVSIAGMVGLLPETMKPWTQEGIEGETLLALQSMVRVGREMNIHGKRGWLGGVGYVVDSRSVPIMNEAWQCWFNGNGKSNDEEVQDGIEDDTPQLGYFEKSDDDLPSPTSSSFDFITPPQLLMVQVAQLPIQTNVEFACLGVDSAFLTNRRTSEEADQLDDFDPKDSIWQMNSTYYSAHDGAMVYYSVEFGHHMFFWGAVSCEVHDAADMLCTVRKSGFDDVSLTVYLGPQAWSSSNALAADFGKIGYKGVGYVPVFGVWWAKDGSQRTIGFAGRYRRRLG